MGVEDAALGDVAMNSQLTPEQLEELIVKLTERVAELEKARLQQQVLIPVPVTPVLQPIYQSPWWYVTRM